MRKALSLLVAIAAVCVFCLPAFAAADEPAQMTAATVSVSTNEIVIVDSSTKALIAPNTHLLPGREYTFTLYRVTDGAGSGVTPDSLTMQPLTRGDLNDAKLRLRAGKGTSAIASAKIEERGSSATGTYNLVIITQASYSSKMTEVEYTLTASGTSSTIALQDGIISFQVGYSQMTDDEIAAHSEGDVITIDPNMPVILKAQFDTLSRINNYKNIQFEARDAGWSYVGRTTGMGDTNFVYTYEVIPSIVTQFDEHDFKFLTFNAGVTFPTNGEMRIDVSDLSGTQRYAYLYRDGKFARINFNYDSGTNEIVFRTNYLGAFVITDKEITQSTNLNPEDTIQTPSAPSQEPEANTGTNNNVNPNTGAGAAQSAAGIVALAALAAVALLARKK